MAKGSSRRPARKDQPQTPSPPAGEPSELRVIGGKFRGRKLAYSGDSRTRPMKERVRESLFNLVGAWVPGKHVFDLFAGTGALGIEALSRGAVGATLIERHFPTAALIRQNLAALGCSDLAEVVASDTFFWAQTSLPAGGEVPWLVLCSPPWSLFAERGEDLVALVERCISAAPAGSVIVVEADTDFDSARLPRPDQWRVRDYPPARLCTLRMD